MTSLKEVNDQTFRQDVIESSALVVVDFFGKTCAPCKALLPHLHDINDEYAGDIEIVKVDIEESPMLAETYDVLGVPTVMIFRDGAVQERQFGYLSRSVLVQMIDRHLAGSQ